MDFNQNQSYNQQSYPQNNPYSQPSQVYIPPSKKPNYVAVGFMIFILICAIGLYFLMKPKLESSSETKPFPNTTIKNETKKIILANTTKNITTKNITKPVVKANITQASDLNLSIYKLKLCRGYESQVCDENVWRSFKKGDNFYAYLEINVKIYNEDYLGIQEGVVITDSSSNVIYTNKEHNLENIDTYDNETNLLPLIISIPYQSRNTLGKQTLELTLTDTNLNQEIIKKIDYDITS